jgi:hypothetical protein
MVLARVATQINFLAAKDNPGFRRAGSQTISLSGMARNLE